MRGLLIDHAVEQGQARRALGVTICGGVNLYTAPSGGLYESRKLRGHRETPTRHPDTRQIEYEEHRAWSSTDRPAIPSSGPKPLASCQIDSGFCALSAFYSFASVSRNRRPVSEPRQRGSPSRRIARESYTPDLRRNLVLASKPTEPTTEQPCSWFRASGRCIARCTFLALPKKERSYLC